MRFRPLLDTRGQRLSSEPPTFNTDKNPDSSYLNSSRTHCNAAFVRVSDKDDNRFRDLRRLRLSDRTMRTFLIRVSLETDKRFSGDKQVSVGVLIFDIQIFDLVFL